MERKPTLRVKRFFTRVLRSLKAGPQHRVQKFVPASAITTVLDADLESRLRGNERIWAGFRELELRILAAETLSAVIEILGRDLPAFFSGVHAVTLAWLDPEYELTRLIQEEGGSAASRAFVALQPPLPASLLISVPRLGPADLDSLSLLFAHSVRPLRSMAIAPLRLRGELIGMLNQGSADAQHFHADAATDLLEHLAAVTAICIDNAINRARLRRDGFTDALTGVANRRFFDRRLHEEISLWRRRGDSLSCLLVDLDYFKQVNDRHGHQIGDHVLQQVARTLNLGLRASDLLARYGGEEFILLLPQADTARAAEIAERLRAAVAGLSWATQNLHVTASIGLASVEAAQRTTLDDPGAWLLSQADQALYAAKAGGRNRVAVASTPRFLDIASEDLVRK